ncbi:MAG: putative DNA binding domain-containing protein [Methyloprofundus sp.]|nr:putative DNA binding domain-containing protein [Methyloprofundus sp.]
MALPIDIKRLLAGEVIESERLEFKAGWNPEVVLRSICAFANDLHNFGGGYIVIGVSEQIGVAQLPQVGLQANQIDPIQKELLAMCHFIEPHYFPQTEAVPIGEGYVLVIWCPPGDVRPYRAPRTLGKTEQKAKSFFVRQLNSTVEAKGETLTQLMQLTAKVAFDNRVNQFASLDDLDLTLIAAFLRDINSGLYGQLPKMSFAEICRQMAIARGPDEHLLPVNVGLLMFSQTPERFFDKAFIEVVEYHDAIGDKMTERCFKGPISQQLREVLAYLNSAVVRERVIKVSGQAEAVRVFNYPFEALEEAVANAVYHKSYEKPRPIEINIRPDCIEILSFPGPVPPVDDQMLKRERVVARDYRNSRIGDFLKELKLTEGRGTGFPKMRQFFKHNGSPPPVFETDPERSYFLTTFFPHPTFTQMQQAKRDEPGFGTKLALSWDQAKTNKNSMLYFIENRLGPSWDQAGTKLDLSDEQVLMLELLEGEKTITELLDFVGRNNRTKFRSEVLNPLLELGVVEMTVPDKPTSPKQKYRLNAFLYN